MSTLFLSLFLRFTTGETYFSLSLSLSEEGKLRFKSAVLSLHIHAKKIGTIGEKHYWTYAHALVYYFFYEYLLVF